MKKNGGFLAEFKLAIPRFVLASIIAFVISRPLELQIFHTSVEYELEIMKQEELVRQESAIADRYNPEIQFLESEIKALKAEIGQKQISRDKLDDDARKEADGTGGSQKRGAKTIYNLKRADATKSQAEFDSLKAHNLPLIASKQLSMNQKRNLVDSLKTNIKRGAYDGFDKRLDALGRTSERSSTISIASWFVMLLFLAIEIAPVLVKLLSPRGPYDDLLEKHEHAIEIFKIEEMSKLNQKTNEKLERLVKRKPEDAT